MRLLLYVLLSLAVVASAFPAEAENRALLVGIGKYAMKGIDLPGIDKDVNMMREVALELGYEKDQIMVLLDEDATLANIRKTIDQWLVSGVSEDDSVFFYYSGHGSQIYDTNHDEADNADEVLVCHDAALGKNTLKNVFVDDMFREMLAKIPSKKVFVLVDACHSGTATRSALLENYDAIPKFFSYPGMPRTTRSTMLVDKSLNSEPDNYAALSAAEDNQRAQASSLGSYFTRGVKDAVDRASKSGRSIDMTTLHDKAATYIVAQLPDPSLVHRPHLVGGKGVTGSNMFIDKSARKPERKPAQWNDALQDVVNAASYAVTVKTNGTTFRTGEALEISCFTRKAGYLNVVSMQDGDKEPTVLFPNQFHPENRVEAGQEVSIPADEDEFALTATPPTGKIMITVFHSPFPVNFYKQGYGDGAFKTMAPTSTRGFMVTAAPKKEEKPEPVATPAPTPEPAKPEIPEYGAGVKMVKVRD